MINKEMIEQYLIYQRKQERSKATLQKYKHDLNEGRVCPFNGGCAERKG